MIKSARLGRKNTIIARMAFIEKESDADIAAVFDEVDRCSRTTVGRRRRWLEELLRNALKRSQGC